MSDRSTTSDDHWLKPPDNTIGLHQVYPDPKTPDNATIDIIAVHGLGGDSYSTFTRDGCLWIRDLLPSSPYFESARIMTFGYDARAFLHPFAKANTGRTFTFAEALLNDLADKRISAADRARPIIFLGHSLGGIVIKSALNYAHARSNQYHDILESTKAIVFFGTPHQGADVAIWATFLGSVGKAVRLRNTKVVDELQRWSNPLVELTTTFSNLASRFQISTYFETRPTNGVMVVAEGSARMGQEKEVIRGLEADHHDICKFTVSDRNWTAVRGRFEAIAVKINQELLIQFPVAPVRAVQGEGENDLQDRMEKLSKGKVSSDK